MHAWSENWWQRNQPNSDIIVPFLSQNINATQNKHNKHAMVCEGPDYPSKQSHRGVPFFRISSLVLKRIIKVIANQ